MLSTRREGLQRGRKRVPALEAYSRCMTRAYVCTSYWSYHSMFTCFSAFGMSSTQGLMESPREKKVSSFLYFAASAASLALFSRSFSSDSFLFSSSWIRFFSARSTSFCRRRASFSAVRYSRIYSFYKRQSINSCSFLAFSASFAWSFSIRSFSFFALSNSLANSFSSFSFSFFCSFWSFSQANSSSFCCLPLSFSAASSCLLLSFSSLIFSASQTFCRFRDSFYSSCQSDNYLASFRSFSLFSASIAFYTAFRYLACVVLKLVISFAVVAESISVFSLWSSFIYCEATVISLR